jgi:membrane protein implicated in regulation of membrane protease activity
MIIFLAIGGLGFLFLVISLLVGDLFEAIGFDLDGSLDGQDFGLLDSRVISVFLTAFGGFGAIGTLWGNGALASSAFGLLGGVIFGAVVYYFGKLLYSQQSTSSVTAEDLIGRTAQVTVAIHPNQLGQVTFTIGEERVEKLARSADNSHLEVGTIVKVDAFAGDSVLVRADKGEGFLLFTEKA